MRHAHPDHPAAPERSHRVQKRTDGERCSLAIGSASFFADNLDWDGEHFLAAANGKVLWETARHTHRGGAIRLMRLDNSSLKVTRAYVPLDYPMRLVAKTPNK